MLNNAVNLNLLAFQQNDRTVYGDKFFALFVADHFAAAGHFLPSY
jgi:hypothetical protein